MKLLLVSQVAEQLNCSERTVYRLIESCELTALKVRGCLRIPDEALLNYVNREISKYMLRNGVSDTACLPINFKKEVIPYH